MTDDEYIRMQRNTDQRPDTGQMILAFMLAVAGVAVAAFLLLLAAALVVGLMGTAW